MNAIGLAVLFVLTLVVVTFLRGRTCRRRVTPKTAWNAASKDEQPYPCVTVWLTRDGNEAADRRILEVLAGCRNCPRPGQEEHPPPEATEKP